MCARVLAMHDMPPPAALRRLPTLDYYGPEDLKSDNGSIVSDEARISCVACVGRGWTERISLLLQDGETPICGSWWPFPYTP